MIPLGARVARPHMTLADLGIRLRLPSFCFLFQQDGYVGNGGVVSSHAFGRLGFDPHTIVRNLQQSGDVFADLDSMRADLGRIEDQRGIDIDDLVSGSLDPFQRFPEENDGISPLPLRIRGRKQRSDVGSGNCS